jgi:prepilin-type N-terminal cleavage/methylation domain-containing protein
VNSRKLKNLLTRKVRRNNQKGFTLIELLVVISILGILAAVVTLSLVGLTGRATNNANSSEHQLVQAAFDTMIADQAVPGASICPNPGAATTDMSTFPQALPAGVTGPVVGPNNGVPVPLYPTYVHTQLLHRGYACDASGHISP